MKWQLKAALQKTISLLPRAEDLNYLLQRYLTSSLPCSDETLWLVVDVTRKHWELFEQMHPGPRDGARLYEFGAGWDLIGPLTLWVAGARDQTIVDIKRHVRLDLVNSTIDRFRANADRLGSMFEGARIPAVNISSLDDLERAYGIRYLAPCDARATGLPAGSIDLITNTHTLEHIPAADIGPILNECARLLSPNGVASFSIDLNDHYAYMDPSISQFNFLRYEPGRWDLVNSGLHFQNRLRRDDYRRLFADSALRVHSEETIDGSYDDHRLLESMNLASAFRGRSLDDLSVHGMHVVAATLPGTGSSGLPTSTST